MIVAGASPGGGAPVERPFDVHVHICVNLRTDPPSSEALVPFKIHVPDAVLHDLKARLRNTRLPQTIPDAEDYGTDLTYFRSLLAYWRDSFDWRAQERKLNDLPQFKTTIDGIEIHFVHVKSKEPHALPLAITHGWPGSFVEFTKIIGPLTWIVEKFHAWCDCDGDVEKSFTKDELLTNITLYWATGTGPSSARIYYENRVASANQAKVTRRTLRRARAAGFARERRPGVLQDRSVAAATSASARPDRFPRFP